MDYEEHSGSAAGHPPSEREASSTDAVTPDGQMSDIDIATGDLGSESSLMSDESNAPAPPEWPAVDLKSSVAQDDENVDLDDDSDAPVQLDDAVHATAENINLSQGGVQSIEASTVTLSQGGAGQVRADTMSVEQGGVGLARVGSLTLGSGASAFAVVADQATVEEGSNTFLVVSRSFSGETRPTIDWRSAMAFGAGLGLIISILRRHR